MALHIITDSTCDISQKDAGKLGIKIVPLTITFGEDSYCDGIDLSSVAFYHLLKTSKHHPTTSQVTVGAFIEAMSSNEIEDEDDILIITLSQKLSGTYQSAAIARDSLSEEKKARVHIIDSNTITAGLALLVYQAIGMRKASYNVLDIIDRIEKIKPRIRVYATLSTLKFLYRGGRLSGVGAVAGTVLGIKPIIAVEDGQVVVKSKPRGSKAAYQWLAERVEEEGVVANTDLIYLKGDADQEILQLIDEVSKKAHDLPIQTKDIGVTVGTHVGNGAVGIAFIASKA